MLQGPSSVHYETYSALNGYNQMTELELTLEQTDQRVTTRATIEPQRHWVVLGIASGFEKPGDTLAITATQLAMKAYQKNTWASGAISMYPEYESTPGVVSQMPALPGCL